MKVGAMFVTAVRSPTSAVAMTSRRSATEIVPSAMRSAGERTIRWSHAESGRPPS
jgi:hypothetical protein